jgi:ADP-ribose pyrophosphatase
MNEGLTKIAESYKGNAEHMEIEITSDLPEVLYSDKYILLVRDTVKFPGGDAGTYIRIVETSAITGPLKKVNYTGSVIIPYDNERIYTVKTFRHATRRWHSEFPRGNREPSEIKTTTAIRELCEETGIYADADKCTFLGYVFPNTGLLMSAVAVVAVDLRGSDMDKVRASEECISEIETWYIKGSNNNIMDAVALGKIDDCITLAALFKFRSVNPWMFE